MVLRIAWNKLQISLVIRSIQTANGVLREVLPGHYVGAFQNTLVNVFPFTCMRKVQPSFGRFTGKTEFRAAFCADLLYRV